MGTWGFQTAGGRGLALVLSAVAVIAVLAFFLALAWYSRRQDSGTTRRRRKRKHRSEHRPRNPTLAETGGLPPTREGDPPGP